ncbi:MAG: tetratricopeptide repeat protein, partial [Methylobacter sp.]|nr:tetratricopeptide repeat protein [Methylobacter sp.]
MNKLLKLCAKSYTEAEKQARKMTIRFPRHEFGWKVLGSVLKLLGKTQDALAAMQKTVDLAPDDIEGHYNLGLILLDLGRLKEAEASYRQALQLDTTYALAYSELGRTLIEQGRIDEAEASLRQALKNKPDFAKAHSGLIFALDLMPNKNTADLQEERQQWDAAHAIHLNQHCAFANIPDPKRRLRIGYVSADFREHSAAIAFGGMLTRYDRSQFDVFAYSNYKEKDDKLTTLFKQNVSVWRNILGLDDDTVAKIIREDQIDILVDLSGHSAGNRLLVFAHKPAPIQITAWGYASSTGMQAMDVFFTDLVTVLPEEQHYFTERVKYLPCTMSALFTEEFPGVNTLPALSDGNITFGSFNRLAKVSNKSYQIWTEVLQALPQSRLILKTPELDDPIVREQVISHFTEAGVAANRIIMQGKTSWFEHMQAYHRVDIALDPFPHGGG